MRAASTPTGTFPHEPNPLLGRDDDITAVASLLRSSRVTSIVGAAAWERPASRRS